MYSDFQILCKSNANGEYVPLSNKEAQLVSVGGFGFEINGNSVPFDWEAFYGTENNNVFHFETGRGLFFNSYELLDCYDNDLKEIGLTRDDITAEFLASVSCINEFYVDFKNKGYECSVGESSQNKVDRESEYKLKLLAIMFTDIDSNKDYSVSESVLEKFNSGIQ